ncbi:MAG: hypothetical protein JW909_05805 [Planctomycetes bacterium]|nr:hypothetical protein [Planctomycetota bacterium]
MASDSTDRPDANLDDQLNSAVNAYVEVAPAPGDTASIDPDVFNRLISKLDSVFWKKVHQVVAERLAVLGDESAELEFSDEDRLLIDFGLLDYRLLGQQAAGIRERLLGERNAGVGDGFSIMYFSDWIRSRLQYYLTVEEVDQRRETAELVQKIPGITGLLEKRAAILELLNPFLHHLPGVSEVLSRLVSEGRLDDIMLMLFVQRLKSSAPDIEKALVRIESAFRLVMNRVADRVVEEKYLQAISEYSALRLQIFRQVSKLPRELVGDLGQPIDMAAVAEKVRQDVKLMRSLLNLGAVAGAVAKPHSVLLRDMQRTTLQRVHDALTLVREVDPAISLDHNVLITPFTGSGFFEWDRDTIVVGIIPARSVEEDVATAVAGMRIAVDRFHHSEELFLAYDKIHHGRDFREFFTRDYIHWVVRVGRGQKQQMDPRSFDFFLSNIGHNGVDPVVPAELVHTSVDERSELYRKITIKVRDGSASARELFLAGVIRWQRGDHQSACRYLDSAARLAPSDGASLYSLGILLRNMRMKGPARKYLVQCTTNAPQTIWQVYAFEALKRLGR